MAFPTSLNFYDYRRFVQTYFAYQGSITRTYAELPFLERSVILHESVVRTKTSPLYLPHRFKIKRVGMGFHSNARDEGLWGSLAITASQSNTFYWAPPYDWDWARDSFILPTARSSLESKCLQKMYEQLKQDQANWSVDAFEARQTIKLVRSLTNVRRAAEEFAKAMRKDRKHRRNPLKRSKYLMSKWLESRYGIRPLVSSIFDTLKALLNVHVNRKVTIKTSSSLRTTRSLETGTGSYSNPKGTLFIEQSSRARMVCTFSLGDTGPQVQDFLSRNPVSWAWELIPLSFVADWFFNVGQTLTNWEDWFRYRNSFVSGMITFTTLEDRTIDYQGQVYRPYEYWPGTTTLVDKVYRQSQAGKGVCQLVENHRVVLPTLPTPAGVELNVNLNAAKIFDICSIITQRLKTVR
jgi:hypothetical protein